MLTRKSKELDLKRYEYNKSVRLRNLERADPHDKLRIKLAKEYVKGKGIEIGGLHKPLNIPEDKAIVDYVDRMTIIDLKNQYPEIEEPMVEPKYIDNGETLRKLKRKSQDFIIACHFYEHCSDPLTTLENLLRVLKKNGIIMLALPDKRFTFDIDRNNTPFSHILKDYEDGPEISKNKHFWEWVTMVEKVKGKNKITNRVNELINMDYSIHYHVWDYESTKIHFKEVARLFKERLKVISIIRNKSENLIILKKA